MGVVDYPVVYIEDPFDKEDWEHVKYFSGLGICQVCPYPYLASFDVWLLYMKLLSATSSTIDAFYGLFHVPPFGGYGDYFLL